MNESGLGSDQPTEATILIRFRDVFHQRPTVSHLKMIYGKTNYLKLINFSCALSAIMHNNPRHSFKALWQADFVRSLGVTPGSWRLIKLLEEENLSLLNEKILALISLYAVKFGSREESIGDFSDNFLRILLCVNEFHLLDQESSEGDRSSFAKIEAQSAIVPNDELKLVIQRFYRFFLWCDSLEPSSDYWLPLTNDLFRLMGLTPDDYLTIAFITLSWPLEIKDASKLDKYPAFFRPEIFGTTIFERPELHTFLSANSSDLETLTLSLVEPTFSFADLEYLIEKPLIRHNGHYFCPLVPLLEGLLGSKFFLRLFDLYEAVDGLSTAKKYSQLYGRFFEEYAVILLRSFAPPGVSVFPEKKYKKGTNTLKTTDAVVIRECDGAAVFVEVTKKRFRIVEGLYTGAIDVLFQDLKQMVISKAQQINARVVDLRNGLYSYPFPIVDVAPMVISGQAIPGFIFLKHAVDKEIEQSQILRDMIPLTQCSIDFLEILAETGQKIDLFNLILEKSCHDNMIAREQSFKNYLYHRRLDLCVAGENDTFGRFEEACRRLILPKMREWGIST